MIKIKKNNNKEEAKLMKNFYVAVVAGIIHLFFCSGNLFSQTITSVTVSPSTTNTAAKYTISGTLENNAAADIDANTDSLIIVFNDSTTVPGTIDPTKITVNNTASNAVDVGGTDNRRVAILSPVNIKKNGGTPGQFTIVFNSSIPITNPVYGGTTGFDYHLRFFTSKTPTPVAVSPAYTITTSSSTIRDVSVTPNPSVETLPAAYTVSFFTGSGGQLLITQNPTITIAFPTATSIPDGAIAGVTVNGTPATATALSDTVIINCPVNVSANSSATIQFGVGSGISNPVFGTYTLRARTSAEPTWINSSSYYITTAAQMSITAVTVSPSTANATAGYSLEFYTSSSGALTANQDSIIFIFQANTFIPNEITPSLISITSGGYSDAPAGVGIRNANRNDGDTLILTTPINIANSASVAITISSGAGILNPSPIGNYFIRLTTTNEDTTINSSIFAITNPSTQISSAIITPTLTAVSVPTSYQFDFNLGAQGRLKSDESTITLDFNDSYTLSTIKSHYDSTYISVGGGAYVWVDTANFAINNTLKTIQITVPSNVYTNNGDNIRLIFKRKIGAQPITNPGSAGNYTVDVFTNVETTPVGSQSYYLGGSAITINSVTLSNYGVNQTSSYTFSITTTQQLKTADNDWVLIVFPDSTVLNTTTLTTLTNMTINGTNLTSITVTLNTRTLQAKVGANVNAGTFNVVINTTANIKNPPVPNSIYYKVTMRTSKDLQPVISSAYAITGNATTMTNVSATASPSVINALSSVYTVNMRTTANGRLVGGTPAGSSTIDIAFGYRTRVPSFITPSSVKVNGQAASAVSVLTSGDSGKVRITIPNGLVIGNTASFSVVFDTSARLDNRNPAGTSSVNVKSTSDTNSASGNYTLTATQSLTVTNAVPTPSTVNAKAGWTIKFQTGSSGKLYQGDTVYIRFPYLSLLPSTFSKSDITVNGINPLSNPMVIDSTLKINIPQDSINNLTNVTILINSTGGINNPVLVHTGYTLAIKTSSEPVLIASPSFSTTAATSTVSTPIATVTNPATSVRSPYQISFTTGSFGRLFSGHSTITVRFGNGHTVSATRTEYDSVYITAGGVTSKISTDSISISSRDITMIVPNIVPIMNNNLVYIEINRVGTQDPITNPASAGTYYTAVKTSVEQTFVNSAGHTISNQPPVDNIQVIVNPDTVNATATDTIRFKVSTTLSSGGTVTFAFPNNTFIPVTIPVTAVRVALGNSSTFNNATAVSTNPSLRTVTVTTPTTVPQGGDSVLKIAFTTAAGIQNPSIFGNYTLQVRTSTQPVYGTSASYTLKPTTTRVSFDSLRITPANLNYISQYAWYFKTGIRGRLLSGTSTITMIFPYDATFTQGVPATSKVTINSVNPAALSLILGTGTNPDTLIATVPGSVTIGNQTSVSVIIDSSAGIRNVTTMLPNSYQIFTSVEPYPDSTDISLPVVLAYFRTEQNNEAVTLNWRTESEVDNAYWLVQKSEMNDPESEVSVLSFETIATLKGQGTITSATDYFWTDSEIKPERTYAYRIVDIAYDGTMTYHEPQKITVAGPKQLALYQNYPNPFNPATSIKYQIPFESKVNITIYNILGQKVTELIDMNQAQGFYTVKWNGKNDRQSSVASGLYIYRIKVKPLNGERTWSATKKMLLLK